MRVLLFAFVTFFMFGCQVATDSSDSESTDISSGDTNISTGTDINDTNSTNGSGTVVVGGSSTSGFSKIGAEQDSNACIINTTFKVIDDSSFDPLSAADVDNGLEIASQYDYSVDLEATKVVLFYPSITTALLDKKVHIYEEYYRLSFDRAWASSSIANVYVRTPKDINGIYGCYRYELGSLSGDSITKTKVYR